MKTLRDYISQVKNIHSLNEYILEKQEQLSDVKTKWHPKEGLFTGNNPQEIANYLLKNSKDEAQAMQRLCFYMNRAGDKLTNKTVLNKVKQILKSKKVEEKLVVCNQHYDNVNEKLIVNKNYKSLVNPNKCVALYGIQFSSNNAVDQSTVSILKDVFKVNDGYVTLHPNDPKNCINLKYEDGYYFHEIKNDVVDMSIIMMIGEVGLDFLNSIKDNVPKSFNAHDFVKSAPDFKIPFLNYKNKEYTPYTKEDIEKFIKDLTTYE